MQPSQTDAEAITNQTYAYAANLLLNQKMSLEEIKSALIERGLTLNNASIVLDGLTKQIQEAKKERAKKDMLYGALWCVGGIIATIADIGFIFWGAIVFGGIQFFKGLVNA